MSCKQEIKYDLRDKTLLEQPKFSTKTYGYRSFKYYGSKLWNALPFEIKNTENYDEFILRLITWCHSSDLDKLGIFWFCFLFFSFWLICYCYPRWQGSHDQHGSHLGSVSQSWARVGPMNFIIGDYYHYSHHHYYHHYYDESLFYILFFGMSQFGPLLVFQAIFLLIYPSVCHWSNYYSH